MSIFPGTDQANDEISLQSVDENEDDLVKMERLKGLERLNEELNQLIQELKAALQG
jgi:hypothetical protein